MNEMRGRSLRTIRSLFWILIFVLGWSDRSVADGLRPTYLDQLFRHSDVVVEVQIESASQQEVGGEKCGTKYTGVILNSYKISRRATGSQVIQFGRYKGLEVGQRYLGFLNYEESAESIYLEIFSDPRAAEALRSDPRPKESVLELIRCNGIIPGLVAQQEFWSVSGPEVIVPPEVLLQVPAGVRVDATDGTAYYLRSSDLSAYLRDLGGDTN